MISPRRSVLFFVAGTVALLVLLVIAARVSFGWYLGSDAFRQRIAASLGSELRADVQLMPLHREGATLYSDGIAARGSTDAFFTTLRVDQLRAAFDWRGLLHRRWQIDELTAEKLDLLFASGPYDAVRPELRGSRSEGRAGWKTDARRVFIRDSLWRWNPSGRNAGSISGASLSLAPDGEAWIIEGSGGKLKQAGWPELQIESAKLHYTKSALWITESGLRSGVGRIAVTGEVDFDRAAELQATLDHMPFEPLLAPNWRPRLSGSVSGTMKINLPLTSGGDIRANGSLVINDGQIAALPMLDEIAIFTRTRRFRRVSLTTASVDFTRDATTLTASNVVLESEGLLRVEGTFQIVHDTIEGQFQVGVTAASLQWLPGSQARVFTTSRGGYQWTTLRVRGPVEHPSEDLTARLAAAAAGQLIDDTKTNVLETFRGLLDLVPH